MEIIKLNLIPSGVNPTCHAKQYDKGRIIRFELFNGLTPYTLQSGDTVTLNLRKPDNTIIEASVTATQGNKYVDLVTTEQMCAVAGYNLGTFKIVNGETDIGTLNFIMAVERDVLADGIASQSVIEDLDALVAEAVEADLGDNYYNKTEVDDLLDNKADKTELNDIRSIENTDLLFDKPVHDNYFIDDSTGDGTTNASFYSYEQIEIPSGIIVLYPYNNVSASVDYIRSICFYDSNNDFISGISGTHTNVLDGVNVPASAKYVSCSLAKATSGYDGSHYLSTNISGDILTMPLKKEVKIDSKQVINPFFNDNNIRMPCVNFQFDDGHDKDADIVAIFKAHNLRCGFALITTKSYYAPWLNYQADGFEILSHSTDATGMDDNTVSSDVIENKLKTSKEYLESWGFKVNGFVTPNSTMSDKFKPLLRKYYQFAETVYLGTYSGTGTPYQSFYDGVYNGFRVSLHSTTLANQKKAVDECIDNFGCLTFYGHSFELDSGGNMSTANLNELLTYIEDKIANGKCICDTPTNCITNFFNVRNDDVAQDWQSLTSEDVSLDSRFNVNAWTMKYSKKQKLLSFAIRISPKVDISGQINPVFTFPFAIDGDFLIQSETGRNCLIYDNGLLIQGNNTWSTGTYYRFSAVLKLR